MKAEHEAITAAETALLVWFAMPLLFLLPSIAVVLAAVSTAPTLPVWGLLALVAFAGGYLLLAKNLRPVSRGALRWIREGDGFNGRAVRTLVMIGAPLLVFALLGRLLQGAIAVWAG